MNMYKKSEVGERSDSMCCRFAEMLKKQSGTWLQHVSELLSVVAPTSLSIALAMVMVAVGGFRCAEAQTATVGVGVTLPATEPTAADLAAEYANLDVKGLAIGFPPPAETVDGQNGFRSALGNLGIGYQLISLNNFANNVLANQDSATNPQQYNGQKATRSSQNFLFMTYDLGRIGLPGGQLILGAVYNAFSWNPGGPNKFGLGTISYFQPLFDDRVEVKIGYLQNAGEFVGSQLAATLTTTTFGPAGNIPYQGGMTTFSDSKPGVNVKFNITHDLYDKFGVQRSVDPDSQVLEVQDNPTGFNLKTPNAGMLYIDELGYRHPAAPGLFSTWIRAGAAYNTSNFTNDEFVGTRRSSNSFYYLLVDRQVWQPDPDEKFAKRGLYLGASVNYAKPELNTFSQYYEFRIYDIGPVPSRPMDVISAVFTDNAFSHFLVQDTRDRGGLAHSTSQSATFGYNAHLTRGIYAGLGLSYVNNPTTVAFTRRTGSDLNAVLSLSLFF
jgi:porin